MEPFRNESRVQYRRSRGLLRSGRSNPCGRFRYCGLSTTTKRLASSRRPGQDYSPNHRSVCLRWQRMRRRRKPVSAGGTAPRMPSFMIEGLAAAMDRASRDAHFRERRRFSSYRRTAEGAAPPTAADLRSIVRTFRVGCGKMAIRCRTYFDDRSCPQDRATAYSPQVRGYHQAN